MSGLEWCKAGWTIPSRKNNAITTFTVCQLDACLHSISFPTSLKKWKFAKRRGTFCCLLWRHVSLSLRDEITHSFLSRQKTRTFPQHVSFPRLPYLTQKCFCLPPFVLSFKRLENSWDALCSTLIFQNLHAPFWPKKTLQNLHHFATQLNSNI